MSDTYENERRKLIAEKSSIETALGAIPRGPYASILAELRARNDPDPPTAARAAMAQRQRLVDRQREIDTRLGTIRELARTERSLAGGDRAPIRDDGTIDYGNLGLAILETLQSVDDRLAELNDHLRRRDAADAAVDESAPAGE